jgi:hypothetical protein
MDMIDYKNVLTNAIKFVSGEQVKPYTMVNQKAIRPHNHEIFLIEQNKVALNAFDNKRQILKDGIGMMAYGHYRTQEVMEGKI